MYTVQSHSLKYTLRKRVSPLCITKQPPIHPTIGAGAAAQISPKKNKEERKRNKCQQRQIDETKMTGDRCTLRRSTTTFPAPEAPRTKQHLQEGGDDDAAAARTSPRVSPGTQEGSEGRGVPDALQEGPTAPTGVAASGPDKPPEISPNPNPHHHPRRIIVHRPSRRPPTCATTVTESTSPSP